MKDLNKLTFEQLQNEIETLAKKQDKVKKQTLKDSPLIIGENYLIRTVTMIYTGKLTKVYAKELVLVDCAWIPETARWQEAVKSGEFNEVEPYPDGEVILNREAVLDMTTVEWQLPRTQK